MSYLQGMKECYLEPLSEEVEDNPYIEPPTKISVRQLLNKFLLTGTLSSTCYTTSTVNIHRLHNTLLELDRAGDRDYIIKAAIYGSRTGKQLDVLAFITTYLITSCTSEPTNDNDKRKATIVFKEVVRNGAMLAKVFAMIRSNVTGVKSMGSFRRRLFSNWFNDASDSTLMKATLNQTPSLKDIAVISRPIFRPERKYRQVVLDVLLGLPREDPFLLKEEYSRLFEVQAQIKLADKQAFYNTSIVGLPWSAIKDCALTVTQILDAIAVTLTDIELLNFTSIVLRRRYDAISKVKITTAIRNRLSFILDDINELDEFASNVEPYRVYQAIATLEPTHSAIADILKNIFEQILDYNAPILPKGTLIAIDFSKSMLTQVNKKTSVTCIEAIAIYAVGLAIKNPSANVLLFNSKLFSLDVALELRKNTKFNLIKAMASSVNAGANCSLPLHWALTQRIPPSLILMLSSDRSHHEICLNSTDSHYDHFAKLQNKIPNARMVCLDIHPNQLQSTLVNPAVTRVGGYGRFPFDLIKDVIKSPDLVIEKQLEQNIETTLMANRSNLNNMFS